VIEKNLLPGFVITVRFPFYHRRMEAVAVNIVKGRTLFIIVVLLSRNLEKSLG
jgi:hypothetical protein